MDEDGETGFCRTVTAFILVGQLGMVSGRRVNRQDTMPFAKARERNHAQTGFHHRELMCDSFGVFRQLAKAGPRGWWEAGGMTCDTITDTSTGW